MSCGCSGKVEESERAKVANRSRAIICQTCIYAERSDATTFRLGVVSCEGMPIIHYVTGVKPCPKGKHPDANGIVRWIGIRWFGVPKPLRVLMKPWLTGSVPGCGCVVRLKLLWLSLNRSRPHRNLPMKRSNLLFLAFLTLTFAAVITFGGCSVFQKPDGTTVTAPSPAKLEAAAAAASTGAGIFGGPIGQAAGAGIAAILLALAAHYRGKEAGWTEKTEEVKSETVKV